MGILFKEDSEADAVSYDMSLLARYSVLTRYV